MKRKAPVPIVALFLAVAVLGACGESDGVVAQRKLEQTHVPRLREVIRSDLEKHREAIVEAAERLAPGFGVEDAEVRERQMRAALRALQEPRRGVSAFLTSPMTFLAAIGPDGVVIARDKDPDPMKGQDFGARFPIVRAALEEGQVGSALVEFESLEPGGESSVSLMFVAPSRVDDRIVGAVALGIPLWNFAKRLSQQMRVEHHAELQQGAVIWVYFYRGDRIFHRGTPPDLDEAVPSAEARAEGLRRSPSGFGGELTLLGRSYGYVVAPTPEVGDGVGIVAIRGEP